MFPIEISRNINALPQRNMRAVPGFFLGFFFLGRSETCPTHASSALQHDHRIGLIALLRQMQNHAAFDSRHGHRRSAP